MTPSEVVAVHSPPSQRRRISRVSTRHLQAKVQGMYDCLKVQYREWNQQAFTVSLGFKRNGHFENISWETLNLRLQLECWGLESEISHIHLAELRLKECSESNQRPPFLPWKTSLTSKICRGKRYRLIMLTTAISVSILPVQLTTPVSTRMGCHS